MIATRSRRHAAAAAVAALLAVPALSACGVNFDAQTDQYYTPTDGENERSGTVDVLHALIISDTPGSGRLIAGLSSPGAAADDPIGADEGGPGESPDSTGGEDDTLTGVRGVGDYEGVQFTIEDGETTIPAGRLLQLADDGSAMVAVSGDPELVVAGGYVRLEFLFENAEPVEINVPVLAPGTDYADVELPSTSTEPTTPDTEG